MPVTVRIWWFRYSGLLGGGHGSVEVPASTGRHRAAYITWNGEQGFGCSPALGDDQRTYGTTPSQTFHAPLRNSDDPESCGLDGDAMVTWFNGRLNGDLGPRHYSLLSRRHNCDGVSIHSLIEGGGGVYAEPPFSRMWHDAYQLRSFIRQIVNGVTSAETAIANRRTSLRGLDDGTYARTGLRSIPTLENWRTQTSTLRGNRGTQVGRIDQLLEQYHQTSSTQRNGPALRAKILKRILHAVYVHHALKPNSRRRQAVDDLGRIVIEALRELGALSPRTAATGASDRKDPRDGRRGGLPDSKRQGSRQGSPSRKGYGRRFNSKKPFVDL